MVENGPFTVVDGGPVDYLPAEMQKPSIYVLFSQPVVPLAKLGEPQSSSQVLEIQPALGGVYRWYGTRLLSFDSAEEVAPQSRYTITVNPEIKSLAGTPLEAPYTFSFFTEPLKLRTLRVGKSNGLVDLPISEAKHLYLIFSYPIDVDFINEFISIESEGVDYRFNVSRPTPDDEAVESVDRENSVLLTVEGEFAEDSEVRIVIKAGARSEKDAVGTREDIKQVFRTVQPFRFLEYDTYSWTFAGSAEETSNPLYLTFSHPLDGENLLSQISLSPSVLLTQDNVRVWDREVMITNLPFAPQTSYTVSIGRQTRDIYGRTLEEEVQIPVTVPEANRYAWFPNTGTRMLEAQFPHKIVYEYQNINDGVWKVGRIDDPYLSYNANQLEPYDFSGKKRNVRHFDVLDLDPWLNQEGKGYVGISWNFGEKNQAGEGSSWSQENLQLQVTDLALTTRIGYNRVLVIVTSLSTGNPVENATVSVLRDRQIMLQDFTDDQGMASFQLEAGEYNRYFQDLTDSWRDLLRVRVEKNADKIEFKPNWSHSPYRFGVYNVSSPLSAQQTSMETLIFTDRALYRPGEKLSYRGIDKNQRLGTYDSYLGPYTVEVAESGYKGKVLFADSGVTTNAGGFFGTYHLPEDIDPGYYVIRYTREGETRQEYFRVALFRRLLFQLDLFRPDVELFVGDTIRFGANASYLAGGKVGGGYYELHWTREPAFFTPPRRRIRRVLLRTRRVRLPPDVGMV